MQFPLWPIGGSISTLGDELSAQGEDTSCSGFGSVHLWWTSVVGFVFHFVVVLPTSVLSSDNKLFNVPLGNYPTPSKVCLMHYTRLGCAPSNSRGSVHVDCQTVPTATEQHPTHTTTSVSHWTTVQEVAHPTPGLGGAAASRH